MKTNQRIAGLVLAALLPVAGGLAGETAVVTQETVNVRGKASLTGEVVTHLKRGEKVVVLEEITVPNPKPDEPSKWSKIELPANTPVWVFADYVDAATKTVKARRLNLRGGPGENYSVVGRLQRGDAVKQIRTVESWMEIEAPPGAYAFVASMLLNRETPVPEPVAKAAAAPATPAVAAPAAVPKSEPASPPAAASPTEVVPPPVETSLATEAAPVPAADVVVKPAETTPAAPAPAVAAVPPPSAQVEPEPTAPSDAETESDEPLPRRIVRREGIVRGTFSIQAPTYFEMRSLDSRRVVNYLHLTQPLLDKVGITLKEFQDWVGRAVIVTGEEAIDPRWPKTPVIEVETLKLVL